MKIFLNILLSSLTFAAAAIAMAGPVNINTADAETLAAELTGIGPALARAIVDDRNKNGLYGSPEDLTRVSGIGMRIIEDNRDFIRVDTRE